MTRADQIHQIIHLAAASAAGELMHDVPERIMAALRGQGLIEDSPGDLYEKSKAATMTESLVALRRRIDGALCMNEALCMDDRGDRDELAEALYESLTGLLSGADPEGTR